MWSHSWYNALFSKHGGFGALSVSLFIIFPDWLCGCLQDLLYCLYNCWTQTVPNVIVDEIFCGPVSVIQSVTDFTSCEYHVLRQSQAWALSSRGISCTVLLVFLAFLEWFCFSPVDFFHTDIQCYADVLMVFLYELERGHPSNQTPDGPEPETCREAHLLWTGHVYPNSENFVYLLEWL